MEKTINLKINGIPVKVPAGTTILEAARKIGVKIPTLCYLKDINAIGACRVCVVEVKGARTLVASCVYPVSEGMEVITNSERVLKSRKTTVELLLSDHDKSCLYCERSGNCELQTLSLELGCERDKYSGETAPSRKDVSTSYIVRDNAKCVLCRRCIAACKLYQGVAVIGANGRGFDTHIGCTFEKDLSEVDCVGCGQCVIVCPTGALHEREEIDDVIAALHDDSKYVIFGTAPATRVGIGEEFGYPIGTNVEGKMVSAIKRLGADEVFDVNFTADLTIMEEGNEFLSRVLNKGVLPMMTSCSPAWIKFVEHNYPELIPNLSTCKSPQQMFGAIVKSYYAERIGKDPKDIVVVSVMPCTAKKFEKNRPEMMVNNGVPDVDFVLTTRELAKLIKRYGIMFETLPDSKYDVPLGIASGAGLIFGVTGGVMEAALRTVREILDNKSYEGEALNFSDVRGLESVKEAEYTIKGVDVKVAVASSLSSARTLCDMIKAGECPYHFIEIMSCPGGCINGGGQPIKNADVRNNVDYRGLRMNAIYDTDSSMGLRKSHDNPVIKELYETYLEKPNSSKAHKILHTSYTRRAKY